MILQNSFFILPIYGHKRDEYYKNHKMNSKKEKFKKLLESQKFLDESDIEKEIVKEENSGIFFISPWKFNDIVGYLEIGMDGATSLTADVYFRRKNFPKDHRVRNSKYSTLQNHEFLYYAEIDKSFKIDISSNNSFIDNCKTILKRADKVIKKRNAEFQLWVSPLSFKYFDFVKAYKQTREISNK